MSLTKSARSLPAAGILRQTDGNRRFTPGLNTGHTTTDDPATPTAPRRRVERAPSGDSGAAEALLALACGEATSMQALAEQVSEEPELEDVLRRAAAQKRPDIDSASLSQAILAVGLSEARMLTAAYAILQLTPDSVRDDVRARVSEGGLRRGVLAAIIAEERGDNEVYPAFIAGMLAENGLLWLAASADRLGDTLEGISRHPGAERIHAERLLTGSDHAAQAALVAPERLQAALLAHHASDTADTLAVTIAAADRVAELAEVTAPRAHKASADAAAAHAGARSDARALLRAAAPRVLALAAILQLSVERQPDPDLLLAERAAPRSAAGTTRAGVSGDSDSDSVLSQLDNRTRVLERLAALRHRHDATSLIIFNFDQFRRVNETYGVPAGDQVMMSMLEGVRGCLSGPGDRIARLGGDTFLVVMPGTSSKLGQVTAERIRSLVERNRLSLGGDVRIACSATVYGTTLGTDFQPEPALRELEEGLGRARQRSRNRVSWSNEGETTSIL